MSESQIITNEKLPNIHPGEILKEDFLDAMNISTYHLAKEINVPETRILEIIHGKCSITADIAIRFSKFFGTTAEFWLNLQNLYDLEEENNNHSLEFETIKMYVYA
ncbi:HigA family addiction module antitoxin [Treponema denticola]|uniref:HigA family addiction module antidote protein n=1 Tax=Treponema denticola SP33 TaxID=999437 RepID=M2BWW8_TREDN|nr:HigA family addiction module antitoxin [Treponema denticola]EMB26614.1 HigA family addiction module antidote protein [Treponema denticola SP33]EPF37384.1 HigA family addiction module antidote protein [Treponema denticola SP32]